MFACFFGLGMCAPMISHTYAIWGLMQISKVWRCWNERNEPYKTYLCMCSLFLFMWVFFVFDFVHLIMVFILISYAPSAKSLCQARYLYWPFILILENRASSTNISLRASNIHKIGDGLGFQISSVCECRGLLLLSIFRAELFRTTLAYSNLIENS